MPWILLAVAIALVVAGGGHWLWERFHRPFVPLDLPQAPSHVKVLRDPEDVQEAARRAADGQMEAVRKLAATEDRWRQLSKGE